MSVLIHDLASLVRMSVSLAQSGAEAEPGSAENRDPAGTGGRDQSASCADSHITGYGGYRYFGRGRPARQSHRLQGKSLLRPGEKTGDAAPDRPATHCS